MSDRSNEESGSPEVSVDARNAAFPCAIFRRCFSSSASLLFQPRPAGLPEDARRGSSVDTLAPSTASAACSTRRSSRYPSVRPLSSLASPRRATPSRPTRARRSARTAAPQAVKKKYLQLPGTHREPLSSPRYPRLRPGTTTTPNVTRPTATPRPPAATTTSTATSTAAAAAAAAAAASSRRSRGWCGRPSSTCAS